MFYIFLLKIQIELKVKHRENSLRNLHLLIIIYLDQKVVPFVHCQALHNTKKSKDRRYNIELKQFFLSLYFFCTKTCRFLSSAFFLPSRDSFKIIITNLQCKSENNVKNVQCFKRCRQISLSSLCLLFQSLHAHGIEFIYSRRLNQDCLENFFCAVREQDGDCLNCVKSYAYAILQGF